MNRKMRRMFNGLAAASFLAAGFVYAKGWQASDTNRRFQNQQQSDQGTGVGRLFRSDVQEAQVGVLMELTGQTEAQIRGDLAQLWMQGVLSKYGLKFEDVETRMHTQNVLIVKKAVEEGKISQEQADSIFLKMSEGPENRGPKNQAGTPQGKERRMNSGAGNQAGNNAVVPRGGFGKRRN